MSYEVIARRWRPQDFQALIGQDHIRTTLENALKHNRLHHALLFTGPRGTGKTSTARILAKALRCPNAVDFVPCHQCSDCLEVAAGSSLNVIEIDGASNNGVDAIRELRETVAFRPSSGKNKIYIIDEVHMLSGSAFNALLKTLEEPPENVYFFMATTEVHKIPNTILSRMQRFDFRRIPTRVIAEHLKMICERDNVKSDPEALWIVARQGDGSMRDAQSLLDQTINATGSELSRAEVIRALGLTDRNLILHLLQALGDRDSGKVLQAIEAFYQSGLDAKLLLFDLLEQIRNALMLKTSGGERLVDLPDSEIASLKEFNAGVSAEDLHILFDMALKGSQDLGRGSDTLLILEMVLLRMALAPRFKDLGTTTVTRPAEIRAPQPRPSVNPTAAPAPSPVSAAPHHTPVQGPIENRYRDLVEKIKSVNGLLGAQLENCFVSSFENQILTLSVDQKHKFLFDKINQPDFKKKVTNYLVSFWGPGHSLNIVLSGAPTDKPAVTPKVLGQQIEATRQQALREAVENHPLVKTAQSMFKTEIKSIKPTKEDAK